MPRTSASSSRTARSSPLSSPTSSEPEDERFQPRANSKAARQADGAPQDALADLTRKLARDPALAEDLWRVLQNLRTEQADGEAEEKRKKVRQGKRRAVETHDESSDEMGQEEHPLISRDRRQRAADEESLIGLEEPSTRKKSRTTVSGQGNAGSRRPSLPAHASHSATAKFFREHPSLIEPHFPASHASPPPPPLPHPPAPSLLPHLPRPKININFRFPKAFNADGLPSYSENQYLPLRLLHSPASPSGGEGLHHHGGRSAQDQGTSRGYRRGRRTDDGGDDLLFPVLLSFLLILIPILVLAAVLGAIFGATGVDA